MPLVQDNILNQGVVPEAIAANTIYDTTDSARDLTQIPIKPHVPHQRPAHRAVKFNKLQLSICLTSTVTAAWRVYCSSPSLNGERATVFSVHLDRSVLRVHYAVSV